MYIYVCIYVYIRVALKTTFFKHVKSFFMGSSRPFII